MTFYYCEKLEFAICGRGVRPNGVRRCPLRSEPADVAIRRNADGAQLVIIPDLYAHDATAGDDEVTVLALPTGFDAACAE